MVPDQIDFFLHVLEMRRRNDNGILFGQDDDILTGRPVGAERIVTTAPHLVAVAIVNSI